MMRAHHLMLRSDPTKTCRPGMAAVVGIQRAQHGFVSAPGGSPDVYDAEECELDMVDLVTVGHELADRAGWARQACLYDVLARSKCKDSSIMLKLSYQPGQNEGVLLGMSFAMCLLHTRIVEGKCPFVPLSRQTAKRLGGISQRERRVRGVSRRIGRRAVLNIDIDPQNAAINIRVCLCMRFRSSLRMTTSTEHRAMRLSQPDSACHGAITTYCD
ncbi:hypothetical protein M436DRAFT_68359 [Aureobasidium namibiae CBS 147.97]|uniref:Uncharacterized protein n=1 Tax=Aureobasidium namibiae CBS 147.97 TaxID=1043004 RepID=A0A074X0P5_9PEZI|nr:uncharacterized protein M436DRAFT_68359 [Aureobasidium namibiae CBS 147.97]KEQ68191.1 hypothetical protein M436DRAFT_68359 [Aureobasidium namibiae CBS 147.97]